MVSKEKVFNTTRFFLISLIVCFASSIIFQNINVFLISAITSIITFLFIKKENSKIFILSNVFQIVGLIFIVILYFGYIKKYGAPYYKGNSDDYHFIKHAYNCIDNNLTRFDEIYQYLKYEHNYGVASGFITILSWMIRVLNPIDDFISPVYCILNNSFLLWSGLLIYRMLKIKTKLDEKSMLIILSLIIFFPMNLYISSHVFRDTLCFFLIIVNLYLFLKPTKSLFLYIPKFLFAYFSGYLLYWVRIEALYFEVLVIILAFVFKFKNSIIKSLVFITGALLFVYVLSNLGVMSDMFDKVDTYNENLSDASGGLSQMVFGIPLFPVGWIARVIYGLITPIPTGIFKFYMLNDVDVFFEFINAIGTLFQLFLLPYCFSRIFKFDIFGVLFVFFLLIVSLTTFTFRHFLFVYPFMFCVGIMGYNETNKNTKKIILACTIVAIIFVALIYGVMKFL